MSTRADVSKWQSEDGKYRVQIAEAVIANMRELAVKHAPNEVGTSLVGSYSDDGHTATIDGLAPLSSDSRGSRLTFVRGVQNLAGFFSGIFRSSQGRRHYVGEWHSHPDGPVLPSDTDDQNQVDIANDRDTDCPEVILVIVGGSAEDFPNIGVFVYSRCKGRIALNRNISTHPTE
ncbi:MAG: Mov34/MPN/PAD-1 family protein [Aureliella sp.]